MKDYIIVDLNKSQYSLSRLSELGSSFFTLLVESSRRLSNSQKVHPAPKKKTRSRESICEEERKDYVRYGLALVDMLLSTEGKLRTKLSRTQLEAMVEQNSHEIGNREMFQNIFNMLPIGDESVIPRKKNNNEGGRCSFPTTFQKIRLKKLRFAKYLVGKVIAEGGTKVKRYSAELLGEVEMDALCLSSMDIFKKYEYSNIGALLSAFEEDTGAEIHDKKCRLGQALVEQAFDQGEPLTMLSRDELSIVIQMDSMSYTFEEIWYKYTKLNPIYCEFDVAERFRFNAKRVQYCFRSGMM